MISVLAISVAIDTAAKKFLEVKMYFYEKLYMSIGHQVIITLPLSREWSPPVSGTLEEVGLDYAVVKPSGSPEDYTGVGGRWFVPLEDVFLIYHPRYCEECSAE